MSHSEPDKEYKVRVVISVGAGRAIARYEMPEAEEADSVTTRV